MSLPVSRFIDAHVHGVDFLQEGDGLEQLLRAMDAAGIERAVVFGLPLVKKWSVVEQREPHYYLDDNARCYYYSHTDQIIRAAWEKLPASERGRLAPLVCGFNPTDRHGVKHVERVLSDWPEWRGVGEVLLRHDDLTNLTQEETARANHPAMDGIYQFCTRKNLPLLLHQNSTSIGVHNEYIHLHELEEALAAHPELTVVWAHCGISRRVFHSRYHKMLADMLRRHPRLHADISWFCRESVISHHGKVAAGWSELIEEFPDRFLLGSDMVGHYDNLGKTIASFTPLLESLSPATREQIDSANAARIFFGE